ncbi:DUF6036 family nucleotidyltransferase [Candidatus Contubernalis alkaliaceticus]|uniref:DUF6036 family nucleotidyltransferase n=1 Tax=Candidatus Contubernalis alkaliaceticus TaxID=338645 RepID=UPI001F4BE6DA|nr:DUF6036 family nucleotidyltransferase [Candidatus Contubernalis alkalaceticus]UNC93533.1 hypothetical protein HUE98_16480 [Candidatus Contubernalis alkalaceticus]
MKIKYLEWAIKELKRLNPDDKYNTMLYAMAIITKLLEVESVKPIIVGGFSVEIYTDRSYSTRDLDVITNKRNKVIQLLQKIGFKIEGRHLVYNELDLAIEFPDDELAGSYGKVNKININETDNLYVYVISYEDIIMDRLRAFLYWNEHESKEWGMKVLFRFFDKIDLDYMMNIGGGAETKLEVDELNKWLTELDKI